MSKFDDKMTAICDALRSVTGIHRKLSLDGIIKELGSLDKLKISSGEISSPGDLQVKHGLESKPEVVILMRSQTVSSTTVAISSIYVRGRYISCYGINTSVKYVSGNSATYSVHNIGSETFTTPSYARSGTYFWVAIALD